MHLDSVEPAVVQSRYLVALLQGAELGVLDLIRQCLEFGRTYEGLRFLLAYQAPQIPRYLGHLCNCQRGPGFGCTALENLVIRSQG